MMLLRSCRVEQTLLFGRPSFTKVAQSNKPLPGWAGGRRRTGTANGNSHPPLWTQTSDKGAGLNTTRQDVVGLCCFILFLCFGAISLQTHRSTSCQFLFLMHRRRRCSSPLNTLKSPWSRLRYLIETLGCPRYLQETAPSISLFFHSRLLKLNANSFSGDMYMLALFAWDRLGASIDLNSFIL